MKLKTRIVVMTTVILSLCCVLLYLWTSISNQTMVKNIHLLEGQKYAKLQSIHQENQQNQERLLVGLCTVVVIGSGVSWYGADLALKPVRKMTRVIKDFQSQDLKTEIPLPRVQDENYELILAFNQMTKRLNQAFEREKRITADIAHEFRTPLAVLLTKYEVLQMAKPKDVESYERVIDISKEKVEYLSRMTGDMLRLYRETRTPREEDLELSSVLRSLKEDFAPLAGEKQVSLELHCQNLPIHTDPVLFRQMIGNLIDNGIRYNLPGGKLSIDTEVQENNLLIRISDTGIGIPEDKLDKIFAPFYRVDDSRSRQSGGNGLGLAFSYMAAESCGGTIHGENLHSGGCRFSLKLPILIQTQKGRTGLPQNAASPES